ncbi:MAG: hypothetical protein P0S95_06385 [Rhabdochlamydiaceae bacterium]|nr:hypothetical protein [Candidatus Amphrikana amoebophyrae]
MSVSNVPCLRSVVAFKLSESVLEPSRQERRAVRLVSRVLLSIILKDPAEEKALFIQICLAMASCRIKQKSALVELSDSTEMNTTLPVIYKALVGEKMSKTCYQTLVSVVRVVSNEVLDVCDEAAQLNGASTQIVNRYYELAAPFIHVFNEV